MPLLRQTMTVSPVPLIEASASARPSVNLNEVPIVKSPTTACVPNGVPSVSLNNVPKGNFLFLTLPSSSGIGWSKIC